MNAYQKPHIEALVEFGPLDLPSRDGMRVLLSGDGIRVLLSVDSMRVLEAD